MADAPILVCACGMKLRAPGALPGRVGKCPACGGLLRVPEPGTGPTLASSQAPASSPDGPDDETEGDPVPKVGRPSSFVARRVRNLSTRPEAGPAYLTGGLLGAPKGSEGLVRESLLYPLRADASVALLVLLPPILWLVTIPVLSLVVSGLPTTPISMLGTLLSLLPTSLGLLVAGSYTLLYLGRVLASSALGEPVPPRLPDWEPAEILRGIGRWVWALASGAVLGGLPAAVYWVYCGDIDPLDLVVLAELAAVGALYAQVALLASILHDDPLGANPLTVLLAIWRAGWGWLVPSLVTGGFATLAALALAGVLRIRNPPLSALAYWVFWVYLLYGAMVVLRVLGRFYQRHARVLGWFRQRPGWGA